jgi:hypothetical protein
MRIANQGGMRPPWRGRSALPVRLAIQFQDPDSVEFYQIFSSYRREVTEHLGASTKKVCLQSPADGRTQIREQKARSCETRADWGSGQAVWRFDT